MLSDFEYRERAETECREAALRKLRYAETKLQQALECFMSADNVNLKGIYTMRIGQVTTILAAVKDILEDEENIRRPK